MPIEPVEPNDSVLLMMGNPAAASGLLPKRALRAVEPVEIANAFLQAAMEMPLRRMAKKMPFHGAIAC